MYGLAAINERKLPAVRHALSSTGRRVMGLALAFAILVTALLWQQGTALGATFTLRDGKLMEGEIVYASASSIMVREDTGRLVQLSRRAIESIELATDKRGNLSGTLENWDKGVYEIKTGDNMFKVQLGRIIAEQEIVPKIIATPSKEKTMTVHGIVAKTTVTPAKEKEVAEPETVAKTSVAPAKEKEVAGDGVFPKIIVTPAKEMENAQKLVFKLSLSASVKQEVLLIYATVDGTALAGSDYESQSGVVVLQPGTTGATVSVPLLDDDLAEGDETFELLVTSDQDSATVEVERGSATILDNEAPTNANQ